MLKIKRKRGETIWLSCGVVVEVSHIAAGTVTVGIVCPREYAVVRGELVPAEVAAVNERAEQPNLLDLAGEDDNIG